MLVLHSPMVGCQELVGFTNPQGTTSLVWLLLLATILHMELQVLMLLVYKLTRCQYSAVWPAWWRINHIELLGLSRTYQACVLTLIMFLPVPMLAEGSDSQFEWICVLEWMPDCGALSLSDCLKSLA